MRNSSIRVYDTGCGKQVEYCGKKLYSESPIEGVSRRIEAGIFSAETLYIVPSPLLGYGIEMLYRKAGNKVDIVLLEHDSELFKLYRGTGMEKHPAVFLPDNISTQKYLSEIPYHKYRKIKMFRITGGYRVHPEYYRFIEKKLQEELRRYWRNRITIIHMFRLWIKNSILNLALNSIDAKDISTGITGAIVILGAGESLEDCMKWVLRVRENVTVFAADTALPALLSENIVPDFVCALEAQTANLQDFINSGKASFHLYGDISSYPNIFRILPGITWSFFSTIFAGNQFLKRCRENGLIRDSLPPLGSVGVTVLELAHRLRERGPIFLGGFDFSYRPGKTHARGTYTHLLRLQAAGRLAPMEWLPLRKDAELIQGKNNQSVVTDPVLKSYAELFRERVKVCGNVYDIGTQGMELGFPRINSFEEFRTIVDQHNKTPGKIDRDNSSRRPENLRVFLEREFERLNVLNDHIIHHINSRTEAISDQLRNDLEECDYLYLDFADYSPGILENPDLSFFKRILYSVSYYRRYLRQGVEHLNQYQT